MINKLNRIESCLFDFDGTLYPSSAGIESQIKERFLLCAQSRLALPSKDVKKLLHNYRLKYRSSILGLKKHHDIDPHDFYEELYSGLSIENMSKKPGLDKALKKLANNIPLFVLSNSNNSFVERGLVRLGIRKYISAIFTIEDNNFIRKPHIEVYEATIKRMGILPNRICMFDDIPSSLRTAKNVGFKTVLVGNGLRDNGYVDLHTGIEYEDRPEWCDYAVQDIAQFIREKFL